MTGGAEAHLSTKAYLGIWVALAILLLLGVLVSQFGLSPRTAAWIVLLLSTVKAWLVVMYYMHLKYDRPWLAWIALFPLVIIALAAMLVFSSRLVRM